MPVLKQQLSVAARGIRAFLNLEAGVTHVEEAVGARGDLATKEGKPERGSPQPAGVDGLVSRSSVRYGASVVKPENVIWMFGSGRSGSTWLSSMMGDMSGQILWGEPWVGTLFGHFYYGQDQRRRQSPQFILGRYKEVWLGSIRDLIMNTASAAFPELTQDDYLVIKEPNGSVGAPLLMEALPESRMILLVRDPRDVVASSLDARREGGWHFERNNARLYNERKEPPKKGSLKFAEGRAENYLQGMGNAKQAYDAHGGPKMLVKYEELRADALGTMKHINSTLGVSVDEAELAQVVEKHSWENIPEEQKGEGKFYRKGKPGGWREDLTEEQAEVIEQITAPLIAAFYP
jgi:Sulfotransferase domain